MADVEVIEAKSVRQGNDRHATIARWIGSHRWKKGASPDALVLLCWCGDDAPECVTRWELEDVSEQLAWKISDLIDDYATDAGQHCQAKLQYQSAAGGDWPSKKFRGLCKGANRLGQTHAYDGSMSSQLQQNQKHLEAVVETNVSLCKVVEGSRTIVHEHAQMMIELAKRDANERVARLEAELAEMRERAAQAEDLAEKAVSAAEENAKAAEDAAGKDDDRVGTFLQLVQNGPQGGAGAAAK